MKSILWIVEKSYGNRCKWRYHSTQLSERLAKRDAKDVVTSYSGWNKARWRNGTVVAGVIHRANCVP